MDDQQILELYWERNDAAIAQTAQCYGRYCRRVAVNILGNEQDAEECVNEAYFHLWNAIPPERPAVFGAYAAKITRNLALNRYRERTADKRGGGEVPLLLSELADCLPSRHTVEQQLTTEALGQRIREFVRALPEPHRVLFVRRYWYGDSLKALAGQQGVSESRLKSQLHRQRKQLQAFLEKGGFDL